MAIPPPEVIKNTDGTLQRVMAPPEPDGGQLAFEKIRVLDNGEMKLKYCFVWIGSDGSEKHFRYPTWIPNGHVILDLLFQASKAGWFTPGEKIE